MKKESGSENISEMEQIQRGLEAFLEQELMEMQKEDVELHQKELKRADGESEYKSMTNKDTNVKSQQEEIQGENTELQKYNMFDEDEDDTEDWDSLEHRRKIKEHKELEKQRKQGSKQKNSKRYSETDNKSDNEISDEMATHKSKKSQKNKKKKRKSKWKRFLITVIILLALLAGGLYYVVGKVYGKLNYDEIESVASEPLKDEGIINVLLIGNDSRNNGEDGRSDAMILVSINNKTNKIYMTSLLRDMYVEIPGYKNNRLNAAYSFGGAELLMETVEQNFDIEVNRYVQVNFEAFANLVDAVGGIELELTTEEIEYVNGYLVEYNMLTNRPQGTDNMDTSVSGLVHLNGPQALAYTRNRYIGTDFGRTERQRKVLEAVIHKLPNAMVSNPTELINGLMPNLTTNLTQNECYNLSLTAAKYLGYDIVQSSIPQDGTYTNATIRDMSVLEVDFEANRQFLQDTVYADKAEVNEAKPNH